MLNEERRTLPISNHGKTHGGYPKGGSGSEEKLLVGFPAPGCMLDVTSAPPPFDESASPVRKTRVTVQARRPVA